VTVSRSTGQIDRLMDIRRQTVALRFPLDAAGPVNRSLEKSLQFSVTRILMKIFKTRSSDIVMECPNYFGFYTIYTLIRKEKQRSCKAGKFAE